MLQSFNLICRAAAIIAGLLLLNPAHADMAPVLKVGATASGIPFTFLDIKTNTIEGMMVDAANQAAKAGQFRVEVEQTSFASLIPALTSGKIDMISAGMLKTAEREKVVDFSAPLYRYGEGVLVNADDAATYPNLDALKGQIVGTQTGTVFYDLLTKMGHFKEVRTYDSIADMARDVALGRIKAAVGDMPIMAYQIKHRAFRGVKLAQGYQPTHLGEVCFVVRKGDSANLQRLNDAIARMKADGSLTAIINKWGV
ncbi:amino acid ABC transporter substrate-binding protein [Affinibrenneria salicis]|uniref:Amino acid ABC transporter substrate-binding protein n=1 Tax=Affinibrenneria salicis TaxID=2590031 RepID=A0A5J5FYY2_9GAMM|nr:ABC transporter substrate-binding protein [Affinibrenneria salicis]KAA8998970.1 amino acid ABC transporter substrate-binding protein [Affinibrenneria salicis]